MSREEASDVTGEPRGMTVREAGRRGGRASRDRCTADKRRDQASLGGQAKATQYDSEHYAEMGRRGDPEGKRRGRVKQNQEASRTQELIGEALRARNEEREET